MNPTRRSTPLLLFFLVTLLAAVPFAIQTRAQNSPSAKQKNLVVHFWQVASTQFYKQQAVLESEARDRLGKMIDHGAEAMIKNNELNRLKEAEDNLRNFCDQAVKYAVKDNGGYKKPEMRLAPGPLAPIKVTAQSIIQTQLEFCPLFPFC